MNSPLGNNTMPKQLVIALSLLAPAWPSLAQPHDHHRHHAAPTANPSVTATLSTPASALPLVSAEVRRVDTAAGKVTLKHGEIPNLDMPPMTMVFQMRDPVQWERVKVGDKVRVTIDKVNGAYTVIDLHAAP